MQKKISAQKQNCSEIDLTGFRCPLPVLKLRKRLQQMQSPFSVIVLADDPMAQIDIAVFCQQRDYQCQIMQKKGEVIYFLISQQTIDENP